MNRITYTTKINLLINLIILISLSACSFNLSSLVNPSPTTVSPPLTTQQDLNFTQVTFKAKPPAGGPAGNITLEILDDITGLAINPQRYPMAQNSDGLFSLDLIVPVGSVIKYRYLRGDFPYFVEYNSHGEQVRYRMVVVNFPTIVEDTIAGWTDYHYAGAVGRIKGQVFDAETKSPYPNAIISIAGLITTSSSDGSFYIENVAEGYHNLVVYSLDGNFQTFQQGAIVAPESTTLALTPVTPSKYVNITFIVQTPSTGLQGLPVRMVGNLYSLGNTFADLGGGYSVIAARAPLLTSVAENAYTITLRLPAGFDLRYKYTLGDGFWNAEHDQNGNFVVRQLIVPSTDTTINDQVATWQVGDKGAITFLAQAPENTPIEDTVSIQFNPYVWTPPIPMWPLGNNQWLFVLYSPLNMVNSFEYRYCRNDQCGYADDIATANTEQKGYPVTISNESQIVRDEIKAWVKWDTSIKPYEVIEENPQTRSEDFTLGIEFSPKFSPTWQPYIFWGMNKIKLLNANTVILTPTWSYSNDQVPVIEAIPGYDPLWLDNIQAIQTAQQSNLSVWLYPRFRNSEAIFDVLNPQNSWWNNWFEQYSIFAVNFADLAAQTNTPALILGGMNVLPALPDNIETPSSSLPENANSRWQSILESVRQRYTGRLGWSIPIQNGNYVLPEWIEQVDFLYIEPVFADLFTPAASLEDKKLLINNYLDTVVFPIWETTGKPIFLALSVPSTPLDLNACATENCPYPTSVISPLDKTNQQIVDLQLQADIYNVFLSSVNDREWISGVVSQGYYPPAAIQDASTSINGKPASDVLWYWYSHWISDAP